LARPAPAHGGFEAGGLRDAPHGHEAAVAPAGEAEPVGIYGRGAEDFIDASEDVAEIAVAEIADVGAREGFALTETAAGIGLENEIPGTREGDREVTRMRPFRLDGSAGAAMNFDNHRIFFAGSKSRG